MDSFAKAKLKNENEDLRAQINELNHKLDIVNASLNKFIHLSQKQDAHIKILEEKYDNLKMIMRDEIDQSFKFKQLIEFIKLKNNIIKISKINDQEDQIEMFINQYIQNNKNNESLKKIFPSGCNTSDYYKYYRDLKEVYNRVVHNS